MAACFGLITGLVEGLGLVLFDRFGLLSHNAALSGVSIDMLWASPVTNLGLFLVAGVGLFAIARVVTRHAFDIAVAVLAMLMFADWAFLPGQLHWTAVVSLSAGLAAATTRWLGSVGGRAGRVGRLALPMLVSATCLAVLAATVLPRWTESRNLRSLPPPRAGQPNILLVIIDTLRADRLSTYGYQRPTSPTIDRMAREGVLFEWAFATSSWTLPSHASMLTGRLPSELGAETTTYDGRFPTLPEVLRDQGYRTGAFSGNLFWFTRQRGFGRGFMVFQDKFGLADVSLQTVYGRLFKTKALPLVGYSDVAGRASATEVNRALLSWLDRTAGRPFLAVVNYYDVHGPYLPPPPFRSRFSAKEAPGGLLHGRITGHRAEVVSPEQLQDESDAYDGAIAFIDHQLSVLLSELARRRLDENTIVVITSDHGESFGEHGFLAHRANLYLEAIRVPLIIHWRGTVPAGARFQRPVTNAWLPATLLDLAGAGDGPFPRPSLTAAWRAPGEQDSWPFPIQELHQMSSFRAEERVPTALGSMKSIVTPEWHYISHDVLGPELYRWPSDRAEQHNLAATEQGQAVVAGLEHVLRARGNRP